MSDCRGIFGVFFVLKSYTKIPVDPDSPFTKALRYHCLIQVQPHQIYILILPHHFFKWKTDNGWGVKTNSELLALGQGFFCPITKKQ